MKISCVLPVYNGEKRVSQAIDSVLNQSFKDFELIIVNDCSTDKTKDIIEVYAKKDNRIKIIHNQQNLKLPAALNKGFKTAQGKYHTWTSDDNFIKKDGFKLILEKLEQNPNNDIVYGKSEIYVNGKFKHITSIKNQTTLINKYIVGAYFMYKAEVFEKLNGYDTTLFCAEDYDFFLRADAMGFKIKGFNILGYEYNIREGSLTTTQRQKVFESTKTALFRYVKLKGETKKRLGVVYSKIFTFKGVEFDRVSFFKEGLSRVGFFYLIYGAWFCGFGKFTRFFKYYFKFILCKK